jgi:hypothetical protein
MGEETETSAGSMYQGADVWTEKDEQLVRQRMKEILLEEQTQYVDEAKELMGSLSNEKIMAIDEFSNQILEKISSNHQEVVFMYNMLSEKQKELKNLMLEKPKAATVPALDEKTLSDEKTVSPVKKASESVSESPVKTVKAPQSQMKVKQQPSSAAKNRTKKADVPTGLSQVRKSVSNKTSHPAPAGAAAEPAPKPKVVKKTEKAADRQPETEIPGNVNLQIQKMYKEGKSVLEISKALDIGQGEVKLVIALYGGRKG